MRTHAHAGQWRCGLAAACGDGTPMQLAAGPCACACACARMRAATYPCSAHATGSSRMRCACTRARQVGEFVEVSNGSQTDPCAWLGCVKEVSSSGYLVRGEAAHCAAGLGHSGLLHACCIAACMHAASSALIILRFTPRCAAQYLACTQRAHTSTRTTQPTGAVPLPRRARRAHRAAHDPARSHLGRRRLEVCGAAADLEGRRGAASRALPACAHARAAGL